MFVPNNSDYPRLRRSPPRRALHVRRREPVEGGICAQTGNMLYPACLEAGEQGSGGEARIDAHMGDLAQAFLGTIDHVEDHVQRTLRSAHASGPKTGIEHVTGLGDGRLDGVDEPVTVLVGGLAASPPTGR